MPIKNGDFVEIEYTGRLKDTKEVFDTTNEVVAKANGLSQKMSYQPVIICIGEKNIITGLDRHLAGVEPGGEYSFEIKCEESFGKKDPKLIQLVQTNKFLKQNIRPFPGLQINIDGMVGTIRTVTGGRTLVDFNHPLSGRDIIYDVKIRRIVADKKEQASSILYIVLGIQDAEITIAEEKARIKLKHELPAPLQDKLKEDIKRLVKLKEVEFLKEATNAKADAKKDTKTEVVKEHI